MTLAVELAPTDRELRALAPEWDALWRRSPEAIPFQSPAWLLPWWEQFGTSRPHASGLRAADGRLLGLLPLYLLEEPPERKLLLMGAGTTDYLDLLLDPAAPGDAAECLLRSALAGASEVGVTSCDLTNLPPGSPLIHAPPPPGWREASSWQETCTVLVLPAGATGLSEFVPSRKRRDLRLARRRALAAGGWTTEVAAPDALPAALDALMRIHQDRWTAAGEAGAFADPRVAAFHRAAAPDLLRRGMLRLYLLRLGGRAAAIYYLLLAGNSLLFYLCAHDRAWCRLSPGTLLMGEIVEQALHEGRRELHFLRGDEPFKHRWGAVERPLVARRLVPAASL